MRLSGQPKPEAAVPAIKTKPLLIKSLVLLVLAVLAGLAFRTTSLRQLLEPAGEFAGWFRELGWSGVFLYTLSAAALILAGVPRLLLCPVAGALYGFWGGLAISTAGSMLSYYGAFLWIRGRQDSKLEPSVFPKQLAFLSGDPGFAGVVIGRLLPAPGMLITLALSLSGVGHRAYLAGSALGSLPQAVPLVMSGALGGDFRAWGKIAVWSLICILSAWMIIHKTAQKARQQSHH